MGPRIFLDDILNIHSVLKNEKHYNVHVSLAGESQGGREHWVVYCTSPQSLY